MLAKIMTGQQQSLFSAMNTNCQRSWWHMTTKRTAKMWDFLNFFLVNINVKLRLCILSPNHGAAKQTLALPVTAARLLRFGIRGVGQVLPCHFYLYPLHLPQEKTLHFPEANLHWQEDDLLGQGMWSSLFFHFPTQTIQLVQLATAWYLVFAPARPFASTTSPAISLKVIYFFPQDKLHYFVHSGLDKRFTRNFNIKWFLEAKPCAVCQEDN